MTFAQIFASFNIALIAGIVAVVLVGIGMTKGYKTKQSKKTANLVAVILGAILLIGALVPQADFLVQPVQSLGGEPLAVGVQPLAVGDILEDDSVTTCKPGQQVEDTTVTLSAINAETAVASGGTHRYRINNGAAKTVSDAGTFTASPGDSLSILFENASTSGAFFSVLQNVIIPCSGTKEYTARVVENGTLVIEVFNEEGNLIDITGENETLAAGDLVTLTANLKGQFQRGFPYGGIVIAEYNSTEIDDVIVDFGGSEINVPSVHTISAIDHKVKAYSVPAILGNEILSGSVVVDADDSINPGDSDDIDLIFRPNNYFINEDTGASFDGPAIEDEDDVATYGHITTFILNTD